MTESNRIPATDHMKDDSMASDHMKIMLIVPPRKGYLDADILDINAPLGPMSLAAYLLEQQPTAYAVEIFDTILEYRKHTPVTPSDQQVWVGLSCAEVVAHIRTANPDLIGVSMIYSEFTGAAVELCQAIKEAFSEKILVIGGLTVSLKSESYLRTTRADFIVRGEGEVTFYELLEALRQGVALDTVAGIAFHDAHGVYQQTPDRPQLQDLDILPFPAYHLVDMQAYFKYNRGVYMRRPSAGIFSSRGCNYSCIFCTIKDGWGKWRKFSPDYVIRHIQFLQERYGIREIDFFDDQLLQKRSHFEAILDKILERGIKIKWVVSQGMSVWLMDEKLIRKMYQTGFYRARFTIDSGNSKSLDFMDKPVDLENARKNVSLCRRLGIWTDSNFIIGLPYETLDDIMKTHEYVKGLEIDWAHYVISQPYEGTELARIYAKEGLIPEVRECTGTGSSTYKTQFRSKYLGAEELNQLRAQLNKDLLRTRILRALNPMGWPHEIKKVNSFEKIRYCITIFKKLAENYL